MALRNARIYVAGHQGILGSALWRLLHEEHVGTLLAHTPQELDLTDARAVRETFVRERPDILFLCAGLSGGILANRNRPADFLHQNLAVQDSLFEAARLTGVGHLVYFGAAAVYPRRAPSPIQASAFLQGGLEGTTAAYAVAKAAGIIACQAYNAQYGSPRCMALVPADLYGPGDDFAPSTSHVLAALVAKLHDAQAAGHSFVSLWGSGHPVREFIHARDVARAALVALRHEDAIGAGPLNVGTGREISIRLLAELVARKVGYLGEILWDTSFPEGAPSRVLDSTPLRDLGWTPTISLEEGLEEVYQDFLARETVRRAG
jgi:GDP-L-fucose synthase